MTNLGERPGGDVFVLARIAGHSSITVTQRYIHPQADAINRVFAASQPQVGTKVGTTKECGSQSEARDFKFGEALDVARTRDQVATCSARERETRRFSSWFRRVPRSGEGAVEESTSREARIEIVTNVEGFNTQWQDFGDVLMRIRYEPKH